MSTSTRVLIALGITAAGVMVAHHFGMQRQAREARARRLANSRARKKAA